MKIFLTISLLLLMVSSCNPASVTVSPTSETISTDTPVSASPTSPAEPAFPPQSNIVGGQWHYMFYYEPMEKILLVNGGPESGRPTSDPLEIWSWDGTQWSLLSADPNGPTWRNFSGAAYDTRRNVLIIHGGGQGRVLRFNETWEWDGQGWALRAEGDDTPKSIDGLMAYDEARNQTILFGGSDGATITNETWLWNGSQWTLLTTDGPAARFAGEMMYDPISQQILMYGGHYIGTNFQFFSDFWKWDGERWSEINMGEPNPGVRVLTKMVSDSELNRILLFGGTADALLSDIWSWDGTRWNLITNEGMPIRSGGSSIAFDPIRKVFVFFGGVDKPGGRGLSDTWKWNRDTWNCVDGCK
jgi:hypothetical protein